MNQKIEIKEERRRGCGYREEPGVLYLVDYEPAHPCGRLPIILDYCPVCYSGYKQARGWTWIDADQILEFDLKKMIAENRKCKYLERGRDQYCWNCPLNPANNIKFGRAGLIWVGEKFYPLPIDFIREIEGQGISRRINKVPHGFKLGETWVFLAHPKAKLKDNIFKSPEPGWEKMKKRERELNRYLKGIFYMFKPAAIEIICNGEESDEKIDSYIERGFTPVFIKKIDEQKEKNLFKEKGD